MNKLYYVTTTNFMEFWYYVTTTNLMQFWYYDSFLFKQLNVVNFHVTMLLTMLLKWVLGRLYIHGWYAHGSAVYFV